MACRVCDVDRPFGIRVAAYHIATRTAMRTPVTVGAMIDKGHGVVGWVGARLASSDVLDQRDIGSRCLSRYRSSVSVHPPRVSSQRARCETHNEKKYRPRRDLVARVSARVQEPRGLTTRVRIVGTRRSRPGPITCLPGCGEVTELGIGQPAGVSMSHPHLFKKPNQSDRSRLKYLR